MNSSRQTARRLLTTRMALALGFGVLLTLLVLSGLNAVRAISQLQSRNEDILQEFLERQHGWTSCARPSISRGLTCATTCWNPIR